MKKTQQSFGNLFDKRLPPVLDAERERALTLEYRRTRDPEIARTLVERNLRLVVKLARAADKTHGRWLSDLVQEGCLGLIEAVQRFDPDKGVRLGTYAVFWIRAHILRFKLDNTRVVRGGRSREARAAFFRGEPAPPELPLELPSGDKEGGESLRDRLADSAPLVDSVLETEEALAQTRRCLTSFQVTLAPRERAILDERLLAEEPRPLRALASRFSLSGERVRQIERDLLQTLRTQVLAPPRRMAA